MGRHLSSRRPEPPHHKQGEVLFGSRGSASSSPDPEQVPPPQGQVPAWEAQPAGRDELISTHTPSFKAGNSLKLKPSTDYELPWFGLLRQARGSSLMDGEWETLW